MSLPETIAPLELATSPETAQAYGELTFDFNPIHVDPEFAAKSPFGQCISHGTMALNLAIEAAERTFGPDVDLTSLQIRFSRPMPVGQTLTAGGRLTDAATGTYDIWVTLPDGTRTLEGSIAAAPSAPPA
ncbi:MaoC family dehydratase [Albimonas sp. CAU 1670]|uniref:MaoC family dehydratase n=1 Tax=Albimonas sp. CAU 1670 TaxID=3032599 RepID=UPI0023DB5429|nr:MaoC family dehydratase [Albimonas sp. CAU 1670]MDF2232251.1 MaoC family dehydratase [Albimonas sp. CAU 1670]